MFLIFFYAPRSQPHTVPRATFLIDTHPHTHLVEVVSPSAACIQREGVVLRAPCRRAHDATGVCRINDVKSTAYWTRQASQSELLPQRNDAGHVGLSIETRPVALRLCRRTFRRIFRGKAFRRRVFVVVYIAIVIVRSVRVDMCQHREHLVPFMRVRHGRAEASRSGPRERGVVTQKSVRHIYIYFPPW